MSSDAAPSQMQCTPPSPWSSTRERGSPTAHGCARGRRRAAPADRAGAPRSVALFKREAGAALAALHAQLDALDASEVRRGGAQAVVPPAPWSKIAFPHTAATPYTLPCRRQEGLDLDASALRPLSLEEELAARRRAAGDGAAHVAGPHPHPPPPAPAPAPALPAPPVPAPASPAGAPPPGAHAPSGASGGQPAAAEAAARATEEPAAGQRAAAGASGGDSAAAPGGGVAAADAPPGAEAASPGPAGGPAPAPGARAESHAADPCAAPASRDAGAAPAAGAVAGPPGAGAAAAAGAGAAAGAPARRRGKAAKAPPEPTAAVRRKAPAALARLGAPDVEEAAVARLRAEREARTAAAARVRPPGTAPLGKAAAVQCVGGAPGAAIPGRSARRLHAHAGMLDAAFAPLAGSCCTAQARRLFRHV